MAPNHTRTSCSQTEEFDALIERVITHYARRLRQLLNLSPDDLADVRQDLAVVVLTTLPKFEHARAGLPTYLDRVLRNAATDILRRVLRDRCRQACEAYDEDVDAEQRTCDITGTADGTDDRCPTMAATEVVDASLALEDFQRTLPLELLVIFRGLMLGLNVSRIARQLGIGESLVRYRMKKLRRHFLAFAHAAGQAGGWPSGR